MEFFNEFFKVLVELKIYFILSLLPPLFYLAYLFFLRIEKLFKNNKKVTQQKRKIYEPIVTEEKKNLGINILNEDINYYQEKIEDLIGILNSNKDEVIISAVEAIMISELYADEIKISEDGSLVINLDTIHKFTKYIFNNPYEFTLYIKAVQTKIDATNSNNKIPLKDVLFMMRNAKKFGLKNNSQDTEINLSIKSLIHEANYENVTVKIIDNINFYSNNLPPVTQTLNDTKNEIVFINEYVPKDDDKNTNENLPFEKIELLEDGKIKITTKDKEIIKDDAIIYSIKDLNKTTVNKHSGTTNTQSNSTEQDESISQDELDYYTNMYGELNSFEKENKNFLRYRCKKIYDIENEPYIRFDPNNLEKSFFGNVNYKYIFLTKLLDIQNSFLDYKPLVFTGTSIIKKTKREYQYLSIDVFYFLNFIYGSTKDENKESLYKYLFDVNKQLIIDNVNILIKSINNELNLFVEEKGNYLFGIVYSYNTATIKSIFLRVDPDKFRNYNDKIATIYSSFKGLNEKVGDKLSPNVFGKKADEFNADVEYNHDTFFRSLISEI